MKEERMDLLKFYCWQLGIETFGQLSKFKMLHRAKTNGELLSSLNYEYQRG